MSDLISREALITVMETKCDESKPLDVLIRNVSVAAIKKAPTVDAVEVVRCKDCIYCLVDNTEKSYHLCMERSRLAKRVKLDDFCSLGEKRGSK